ncbi:hypothetical protein BGZ94_006028 [Podila epigama]|nr:hypothetical protein BGZ94_006028 [Podila epigama]
MNTLEQELTRVKEELRITQKELHRLQVENLQLKSENETFRRQRANIVVLPQSDKLRDVFRIYKLVYPQMVMFKRREYYILSRMKNSVRPAEVRFLTKFRQDDQPKLLYEITDVPNGTYLCHNLRENLKGKIMLDNHYFALLDDYTEEQLLADVAAINAGTFCQA